jgi:hypothetical protein
MVDPGRQSKVNALDRSILPYFFEMLLPADQAATLLVIGLVAAILSFGSPPFLRPVRSGGLPSLIFPVGDQRSELFLRKEHRPSALNE